VQQSYLIKWKPFPGRRRFLYGRAHWKPSVEDVEAMKHTPLSWSSYDPRVKGPSCRKSRVDLSVTCWIRVVVHGSSSCLSETPMLGLFDGNTYSPDIRELSNALNARTFSQPRSRLGRFVLASVVIM